MIVLKFGGTSVANAQNINLVLEIISKKAQNDSLFVVVSAFSGVTDLLLKASHLAASKDISYQQTFEEIKTKHLETIVKLISKKHQQKIIENISNECNQLKTLLDGCYLLGELSPRTSDAIISYGELLSSQIIATALAEKESNTTFKDTRSLIKTNSNFGKAIVNSEKTNSLIKKFLEQNTFKVVVLPGFIASDEKSLQLLLVVEALIFLLLS